MAEAAERRVAYAEYLITEASSATKHEFISGEVVAMAGGTIEHGRLVTRLTALLSAALEGRRCAVLPSDVRVRIRPADRSIYPDLHIVCGQAERDPEDDHAVVKRSELHWDRSLVRVPTWRVAVGNLLALATHEC